MIFQVPKKLLDFLRFRIERFVIKGPFFQLLFVALLLGLISWLSGLILMEIEPVAGGIQESAWWAFLHLSDPGYLGDDQGVAKRILATGLTFAGYVMVMGSLVAIMTQWFVRFMRHLEAGLTPISMRHHVVIVGYGSRTPAVVREFFANKGRLRRFLTRMRRRRTANLVILNDHIDLELTTSLREQVHDRGAAKQIIFRTGTPSSDDGLARVNIERAAVAIVPAMIREDVSAAGADQLTIKTLMSIQGRMAPGKSGPRVVAEILDSQKVPSAEIAYRGPLDLLASRQIISQIILAMTTNPGISEAFAELFAGSRGSNLYLKGFADLGGKTWQDARRYLHHAIPIGFVRGKQVEICPAAQAVLEQDDLMIFVARSFDSIRLSSPVEVVQEDFGWKLITHKVRKILILGCNAKVPLILENLRAPRNRVISVDLMTLADWRQHWPGGLPSGQVQVNVLPRDYTQIRSFEDLDLAGYSNILILASDVSDCYEDMDGRTILGYLLIRKLLDERNSEVPVLVELVDGDNDRLFRGRPADVVISPQVVSHMLASVALHREFLGVFSELFGSMRYGYVAVRLGREWDGKTVSFGEVSQAMTAASMVALGVMVWDDGRHLEWNPPSNKTWHVDRKFFVIVLKKLTGE